MAIEIVKLVSISDFGVNVNIIMVIKLEFIGNLVFTFKHFT